MIQHLRQATAQSKTLEKKTNQDRHISWVEGLIV